MPDSEPEEPPHQARTGRNLPLAVVTGLLLVALIFGTLFTSRLAWFVVVATAVTGALLELYRALRARDFKPAISLGIGGGILMLGAAYSRGAPGLTFALTLVILASFVWFLVDPDRERVVQSLGVSLLGVVYVAFLGAHVVLLRDVTSGVVVTIAYIGLVAFYDIGAYATGVFFGKHLMAPSISPKKSWEGAAGATLVVFVLALAIGPLLGPFRTWDCVALAAVVAVCAPLGDLAESLLKRDLGVKDMGTLLPGHGGILDRIDALLLTAPVFYWTVRALGL